jgi:UDP-2,3-diacylglucosamine pyrophosphatase LpxH
MQLLSDKIPKNTNLYQLGDLHIGTKFHYEKGLERTIQSIKRDPKAVVVLMGDLCEAIAVDDPRYDSDSNTQPVPFQQADDVISILYPIRDKIIAILDGNHELKIRKFVNLSAYISKKLGTFYGTWTLKLNLQGMFKCLFAHGDMRRGSLRSTSPDPIQKLANEKAMLKRWLAPKAGDCLYMGFAHYHKLLVVEPMHQLYLTDDGKDIHQNYTSISDQKYIHKDLRWFGCSGAFFKQYEVGYNSYSEIAGYEPVELGYLCLRIRDGKLVAIDSVKP